MNALSNQNDDIQSVEREAAFQVAGTPTSMTCSPSHTSPCDDRSVKPDLHPQILDENNSDMSEKDPSINWLHLPMLSKLESIHTLIEWQFQHPTRLRKIMKTDDELALWVRSIPLSIPSNLSSPLEQRIEPVGYDSKKNAYWFIGGDIFPSSPLARLTA
jgi:hypothetical protein